MLDVWLQASRSFAAAKEGPASVRTEPATDPERKRAAVANHASCQNAATDDSTPATTLQRAL